jgi:hypothetical protein
MYISRPLSDLSPKPNKIFIYTCSKLCLILYIVKVKVKFTLEQATKAQRRSRGIAVLFL